MTYTQALSTAFIFIALISAGGLAVFLDRLDGRARDMARAGIGAISTAVLFRFILSTDEHTWIATAFAFAALGLALVSVVRMIGRAGGERDADV